MATTISLVYNGMRTVGSNAYMFAFDDYGAGVVSINIKEYTGGGGGYYTKQLQQK
jgi:hypothetical protein